MFNLEFFLLLNNSSFNLCLFIKEYFNNFFVSFNKTFSFLFTISLSIITFLGILLLIFLIIILVGIKLLFKPSPYFFNFSFFVEFPSKLLIFNPNLYKFLFKLM